LLSQRRFVSSCKLYNQLAYRECFQVMVSAFLMSNLGIFLKSQLAKA